MKRATERRKSQKRAGRKGGGRGRRKGSRSPRPILQESALVKATARAAASIKTTLREEPAFLAEEALKEAEQIDMLLGDPEGEDDIAPVEEEDDEPYTRMRSDATRPRSRPAPAITTRAVEDAAGPAASTSPVSSTASEGAAGGEHLFPRNLK